MINPNLPEIKILNSKRKTLTGIGILTLVVGAIYYFLLNSYLHPKDEFAQHSPKETFVIFICGPIYVIMILYGVFRAFNPKPMIIINKDQLWWRVIGKKDYAIPWSEIIKFEYHKGKLGSNVRVFVNNPELYLSEKYSERPAQKKLIEKLGTHIMISAEFTEENSEGLYGTLQNYLDVVNGKPGAKIIPRMENF
jgi:hypothetical protein